MAYLYYKKNTLLTIKKRKEQLEHFAKPHLRQQSTNLTLYVGKQLDEMFERAQRNFLC